MHLLKNDSFEIPNYTWAEGKYYKFNYEIENFYYCPDNIVISNFKAKQYEKEKYIIMDYFILDLVNKKISLYDRWVNDSFPETIGDIEKIKVEKKEEKKEIYLTPKEGKDILITLDKENRIIEYKNENVEEIGCNFLYFNKTLKNLFLPKAKKIDFGFLSYNNSLTKIDLPNVEEIDNSFLFDNHILTEVSLPRVKDIGDSFLFHNHTLTEISLPNVRKIGSGFLFNSLSLTKISLPKVEEIGDESLVY